MIIIIQKKAPKLFILALPEIRIVESNRESCSRNVLVTYDYFIPPDQ